MQNITGPTMGVAMYEAGGRGILHRFCSIETAVGDFRKATEGICFSLGDNYVTTGMEVGVSVGVKDGEKDRFESLYSAGARFFCVDVAHGHHLLVKKMLGWMDTALGSSRKDVMIMAGNVVTPEGACDLANWGADIVKVGIGAGAACETRRNVGVGCAQLWALEKIWRSFDTGRPYIMSDGGIKTRGDIPKALMFAHAVMVGNLLAGTAETPGSVFEDDSGRFYKSFGGSASGENKVASGRENQFVEGHLKQVPFRGHVKHIMRKVKESIQMAGSFVGARTLQEFRQKAKYNFLTGGGRAESKF